MPRPKNQLVQDLISEAGLSRRQAFDFVKGWESPVVRELYAEDRVSIAQGARLVRDYPQLGEQAILALHVAAGWTLRDAEWAFWAMILNTIGEFPPDASDATICEYLNKVKLEPIRQGGLFPMPLNRAKLHETPPAESCKVARNPDLALAEAVAEIRRLREILADVGVDPDGRR